MSTDPTSGKEKKNKLNDVQKRQYYETFVQAEAAMHSAEKELTAAQVAYDQARQTEISDIQNTEAQVREAQAELDQLLAGTDKNQIAAARGDAVTISFDALPGVALAGTVDRIKPLGETYRGDMTYTVVVIPKQSDARLRWNMMATIAVSK